MCWFVLLRGFVVAVFGNLVFGAVWLVLRRFACVLGVPVVAFGVFYGGFLVLLLRCLVVLRFGCFDCLECVGKLCFGLL